MDYSDPFALNIRGVTDLVVNPINKVEGEYNDAEGIVGEKYDALELKMKDEELLKLRDRWELKYAPYETRHKKIVLSNLESYLGKRANGQWLAGDNPLASNLQFESEETFLAATLAKNPEPVVWADNTPEGNAIADAVKTMLAYHSDLLVLRRKFSVMTRQWSIHHLGVLKPGWNKQVNDVAIENRKIENFIFDTEGYVDVHGEFIGYLGERNEITAESLVELFPKHKEYIESIVDNKMGTKVVYTEWWSADNTYCFLTFKDKVLDKFKNPYFKYPEPQTDVLGNEMQGQMTAPRNHFAIPKKPFIFLSVYSLQSQPHDLTGLVEQNIPNQNLITKRTEQIDVNVSKSNNAHAFSEDNFNQETAKQAATAIRKGNPILIPSGGPIDKAILPLQAQSLPESTFKDLENNKEAIRTSWGVQGITATPQNEDQTARGMILNQSHDTSRIGGGIGDVIEQSVAKSVFNWLVQLYYVFYDEQHFAAIMGNSKAVEYITLSSQNLDRQLIISVAADSLKPKDEITNINMAQTLFDKGAIGPKTLLKMLDFPNPDESAADGVLYKLDPATYFRINFPEEFAQMQQAQQQQAQMQMANEAQAQGMKTAATAASTPPEASTEPSSTSPSQEPASAALSQIPLPQVA